MTPEPEDERQEKESREQRLNRLFGEALERDYRSIVYEPVPLFEEKPEAKPEIAAEPQKPERYSPEWHRQATQDFIDESQKSYERRWGKSVWATGTPPAKMRLIGPTGGKISQQVHMINAKLGKGTSQQPLWMTGSQVKRYEEMGGHLSDLGYVVWRGPDDPRVPDIPELGPKGSGASTVWRYLKTLGNAFTRDYRMMPGGVPYQREGAMVPSLNNFRLWAEKGYAGFNYADMLATGMAEELATMFVDPFLKEMSFLPADLSKSAKLRDARRAEQMLEFQGTWLAAITMAAPHLEIAAGAAFAANQSIMLGRKAAERAVAAQNAEKLLKQLKRNPKTKRLNSHAKRKPIQKIEGTNDEILHLPDEPAGIQKTQRDVNPQSLPPTQEFDLAATQATLNDNWRKIANLPGIRRIYQKLSPVTLAKDPVAIADSTRRILRHEATQKHNWLLSPVRRLGSEQKVWGKRAENGLLAEGPLKGKSLNDIRTYPKRYWGKMTPLQRKWIEEMDKLEVRKKNYLLENDVNISLLEFDEGGRYAGRIVVAKVLDNGEIADYAFIVKKRTGVGGKKGFEQHREYTKAADAIKDGYRYLSEEESMYINMLGAYNKVIDQQMMDWFLTKIPWRSTRVPEAFNIAVKAAEFKISKSETLLDIIQQAKNDPAFKVAPVQLRALERIFPDEVASLRAAMKARTAPIDIPVPSTAMAVKGTKPLSAMTSAELRAARAAEIASAKTADVEVFGIEGAKRYNDAQRVANSTIATDERIRAANKVIDDMEAGLTEAQRNRIFGIGEEGLNQEQWGILIDAADDVSEMSEEFLIRQLARNLHNVDPDRLSLLRRATVANVPDITELATAMRVDNAIATLRAKGMATDEIKRRIGVKLTQEVGADDARFLLRKWTKELDDAQTPIAAPTPTAARYTLSDGADIREFVEANPDKELWFHGGSKLFGVEEGYAQAGVLEQGFLTRNIDEALGYAEDAARHGEPGEGFIHVIDMSQAKVGRSHWQGLPDNVELLAPVRPIKSFDVIKKVEPTTAAPVVSSTPTIGRSITEKFKEGLNAGSVFELGEVRPDIGYSWRSMGSNEYNRIIEGKSFGGPAQKGGFWSWFPKYSSNLTGTPQRPKYLVEVEIPSKMESLTRRGTINDVRAVWKSTKKGVWEPEPFAHTAAPPPTTAPARQTAANQAAARKAEIDELFDQASAKTVGSKALLDDDLKKANAVRARKKESLKLRDDESKMVNWPGIRGTRDKAIPKDVAESLKNTFEIKEGLTPSWLATPVNINAISRYFTLGGDASPFTIQWLFMPFNHPKAYAAAANAFARTLISTTHHSKMLDEASDVLSRAHNLEISGLAGTEWTEAFSVGGVMTRGRIRQVLSKPLDPFARAWNAGSDAAGIHMLRSLEPLIKTPQDRAAVEEFVNVFRGMFSSQRIGVSERTRIIESLALLAPRYTRAIFSILANTTRGGLRGELARKSLARGVTGVMSLGFSSELALQKINGATWEEALDAALWRVTPWTKDGGRNPDFMLWRIAGQAVGPGSKLFSIMRLLADTAGGDAHRLIERSFENPLLRWAFFQTSPVVSKSVNFALGQNPMGEPTRDGFLSFAENTIAEGMIPIWVQSVLFEEGIGGESVWEKINKRLIRGAAEFVGLRAFAEFPFFGYQAHAEAVTGKKYHEIQVHEHAEIRHDEGIGQEKWNAYIENNKLRKSQDEVFELQESYRMGWMGNIEKASLALEGRRDSTGAPYGPEDFRRDYSRFGAEYGAKLDGLKTQFPDAFKYYEKERNLPVDEAWRQYQLIRNDEKWDLGPAGFDFAGRDQALESFRLAIDQDIWNNLLITIQEKQKDLPVYAHDLVTDREDMRGYWDAINEAIEAHPRSEMIKRHQEAEAIADANRDFNTLDKLRRSGQGKAVNEILSRVKRRFLRSNPYTEALLSYWGYRGRPERGGKAEELLRELLRDRADTNRGEMTVNLLDISPEDKLEGLLAAFRDGFGATQAQKTQERAGP